MIVLITGSAKGLGREMAFALADLGHTPIIHFRNSKAEAEEVVREILKKGIKTKAYGADLLIE